MREDWIEVLVGDIFSVVSGSTPKGLKKLDVNGEIPFYKVSDMNLEGNEKIMSNSNIFLNKEDVSNFKIKTYPKGTIIFPKRGGAILTNKKRILSSDSAFDLNLMGIIPHNYVVNSFLFNWFVKLDLGQICDGSNVPQINNKNILPLKFNLPPIPIQRAIVTKIENLFASLDKGIADLKKAQEQLKIYRQAVLKKAFEGELTKDWREKQTNLPTADELLEEIKEERQKHYEQQVEDWKQAIKNWEENGKEGKKPSKPKTTIELPPLSEEELNNLHKTSKSWIWCKVDKIAGHNANALKAGPFGSSLKKEFYAPQGYKIYGQEQVISGDSKFGDYYVNEAKYNDLINCAVFPLDILISLVGTVGKVLVLPEDAEKGIINPRLVKITLNSFYDSIFFKYYFESSFLKSLYKAKNHGTTMDVLNLTSIKELPFPLCSLAEQLQIVREIESRLSVCDKVEQNISEALEKSEALRQSILKKAFEGKLLSEDEIDKCKQEADYEPASVLLEKINKRKAKDLL